MRNDTGVAEGGEISLYYDPMIAKLVTHASTRVAAIDAQADALDAFTIEGIRHNIPFLAAIMQHPRWRSGKLRPPLSPRSFPKGSNGCRRPARWRAPSPGSPPPSITSWANANAAFPDSSTAPSPANDGGRSGSSGEELQADVAHEGDAITVRSKTATGIVCPRNGFRACRSGPARSIGTPIAVHVRMIPNGFELAYRGIEVKAFVYTEREARYARLMPAKKLSGSEKSVRCPMPGLVVSLAVAEGQEVKAGETLAVVEAMKMENILRAERDGTIKKIRVKQGDSVAVDAVIMEFA